MVILIFSASKQEHKNIFNIIKKKHNENNYFWK